MYPQPRRTEEESGPKDKEKVPKHYARDFLYGQWGTQTLDFHHVKVALYQLS